MSLALFLVDVLPATGAYRLAGAEGHHAADVQRLRVGERLLLGDGAGGVAECVVDAAGKGFLDLRVESTVRTPTPAPALVVAQGLAKGERSELAVQAMTEVGVDAVVPWQATRSVVRWRGERGEKARQRWVSVAREAAKQSRRAYLPEVAGCVDTPALAARLGSAAAGFVLHEEATVPLTAVDLPAAGEVLLVVGPEGGIDPAELAAFTAAGAVPVRLGTAVLRTSTAGVAALAVLNARTGRWS
ncbi:16S rRNA (uracil(1498)-N(3))-methyltransferase [Actinocatenispora rupis]|uniref:Ribosomal RNA small subunit methyltransferase E n=1 Tax=Actinocatenispora rupis TaxID=519421 RepID=A0A8J3J4Y9_9ACTN|nr:16S rRNA (uracil(1498)-N(3))-methyltransferase [Actinocatenispora rupis]GID14820.1 ribosomal RNA small subunit methyltransferase E [Actinocatenispora rupis]